MTDFKSFDDVEAYLKDNKYNSVDVDNIFWYSETKSCCYDDCQCEDKYNSIVECRASIEYMSDYDVSKVSKK